MRLTAVWFQILGTLEKKLKVTILPLFQEVMPRWLLVSASLR